MKSAVTKRQHGQLQEVGLSQLLDIVIQLKKEVDTFIAAPKRRSYKQRKGRLTPEAERDSQKHHRSCSYCNKQILHTQMGEHSYACAKCFLEHIVPLM
jgi:hypothetical protein